MMDTFSQDDKINTIWSSKYPCNNNPTPFFRLLPQRLSPHHNVAASRCRCRCLYVVLVDLTQVEPGNGGGYHDLRAFVVVVEIL